MDKRPTKPCPCLRIASLAPEIGKRFLVSTGDYNVPSFTTKRSQSHFRTVGLGTGSQDLGDRRGQRGCLRRSAHWKRPIASNSNISKERAGFWRLNSHVVDSVVIGDLHLREIRAHVLCGIFSSG